MRDDRGTLAKKKKKNTQSYNLDRDRDLNCSISVSPIDSSPKRKSPSRSHRLIDVFVLRTLIDY